MASCIVFLTALLNNCLCNFVVRSEVLTASVRGKADQHNSEEGQLNNLMTFWHQSVTPKAQAENRLTALRSNWSGCAGGSVTTSLSASQREPVLDTFSVLQSSSAAARLRGQPRDGLCR
jgi:hypothetical protein